MGPLHIVALSGGKDSTAMALALAEREPRQYTYICNETGDELPEMQAHWQKLEILLCQPIVKVRHTRNLDQEIAKQNMLPSVFARWCTRILKIEPTLQYMRAAPEGSVLYVGLRADEESRPGIYGDEITVDFPFRRWKWGLDNVVDYLNDKGVCVPVRTDCAKCPYQRLGEWRDLHQQHPAIYMQAIALEKKTGATFRSPGRDSWPAPLDELAREFDAGRKLREYSRGTTCRVCSL